MLPGSSASYSYTADSECTDLADSMATSPPRCPPRRQVSDSPALPVQDIGVPPVSGRCDTSALRHQHALCAATRALIAKL